MNNNVQYTLTLRDLFSKQIKDASKATEVLDSNVNHVDNSFGKLGKTIIGAFAFRELYQFGKGLIETTNQVEGLKNQMVFASGSAQQGAKDFQYITDLSNKMGLDMLTSAEAFAKLEGATRGTSIAGQQTKEIFEGVSMASTVMHLSAEQSSGALCALQQIMSKGKVSAEELNGQLGERIPGALGIASRAMKMSTKDLMAMMQKGELMSEDFLPRFAQQLKTEFAGGMANASQSGQANLNRLNNSILATKMALGDATKELQLGLLQGLTSFFGIIKSGIEWVREHKDGVIATAIAVGALTVAYNMNNIISAITLVRQSLMTAGSLAYTIATIAQITATEGLTAGLWAMNVALMSNPIGLVIAVIGLLTAGIVYAYNKFEGFRRGVKATWEVIKGFGKAIWDNMVMPIKIATYSAMALWHALTGQWGKVKSDLNNAKEALLAPAKDLMEGAENASKKWGEKEKKKSQKKGLSQAKDTLSSSKGLSNSSSVSRGLKTSGGGTSSASGVKENKPTNVYITIGSLIENQTIKVENATKEFKDKLHSAVAEVLLNVVNDTNRIATQ